MIFSVEKRNTPEGCHVFIAVSAMPDSTAVARCRLKPNSVEFQLRLCSLLRLRAIRHQNQILRNQKAPDIKGNLQRSRVPKQEAEQIAWLQRKLGNVARVEDRASPYRNGHSIFLVMVEWKDPNGLL